MWATLAPTTLPTPFIALPCARLRQSARQAGYPAGTRRRLADVALRAVPDNRYNLVGHAHLRDADGARVVHAHVPDERGLCAHPACFGRLLQTGVLLAPGSRSVKHAA